MQLVDLPTCRTSNWSVGASGRYWPRLVKSVSDEVEHWSLTALRKMLVKIGAKVVSHGRYVTFQVAEVAVSRSLF